MRLGVPNFIPQRLISAREARGLSITNLADLTSVTKQSISAYEKGKQTPSPTTLEYIAEKLNLPVHFFLKQISENRDTIFFRSLSAASKRSRLRSERRLEWLEGIITYLEDFIDLMPVSIPNFDVKEDPNQYSFEEIEEIAAKCRSEFGLGNEAISNTVRLIENIGAIVARQELDSSGLDAFSKWSKMINAPIIILGTDKACSVRSRLDICHELGHIVMHRSVFKIDGYLKLIEDQAFRFATAFLLPSESFTRDFSSPSLDTFRMLKEKWKVSIACMIMRCKELNILSEKQATQLWISYNRRGWRKKEPLDDKLPIEKPVFIQKCFELLSNERIIQAPEDLQNALSLYESDIEELTGLPRGYFKRGGSNVEQFPVLRANKKPATNAGNSRGEVIPFKRKA